MRDETLGVKHQQMAVQAYRLVPQVRLIEPPAPHLGGARRQEKDLIIERVKGL